MGKIYGKKHNYNLNVFYKEDETSYYLLGLLMTDGCVKSHQHAITLVSKDRKHLTKIVSIICPTILVRNKNSCFEIGIYSKELKEWLISKGCTPQKTLHLQFPVVPKQFIPDFIRGCIDGDGSIGQYKEKSRIYLCGSSFSFLERFSELLRQQGIQNYIYKTNQANTSTINGKTFKRTSEHWRVEVTQINAKKLAEWIYYPGHPISLDRKREVANFIKDRKIKPRGRPPNLNKQLKAKTLRSQGFSLREIAKQLSTSQSRIHNWIKYS